MPSKPRVYAVLLLIHAVTSHLSYDFGDLDTHQLYTINLPAYCVLAP